MYCNQSLSLMMSCLLASINLSEDLSATVEKELLSLLLATWVVMFARVVL